MNSYSSRGRGFPWIRPEPPLRSRQSAAPVIQPSRDHFNGHAGFALNMMSKDGGIEVFPHRVHVMHEDMLQVRICPEELQQHAVAEQVRYLVPVSDGVEALHGKIVGIITCLAAPFRPIHQGGMEAFEDFLSLFIQQLLGHFQPGESEIPYCRYQAQPDAATPEKAGHHPRSRNCARPRDAA